MDTFNYWNVFENTSKLNCNKTATSLYDQQLKIFKKITYGELLQISSKLVNYLKEFITEGENIGILMKHNLILPSIISMVHRLDGAFVFLDPDEQYSNNQFIVEMKINHIFTTTNDKVYQNFTSENIPDVGAESYSKLYWWKNKNPFTHSNRNRKNIAYYIKTSGSTSIAKSVAVTHQCIGLNLKSLKENLNVEASDVIYFSTPLTFDPSIVELYLAALSGAVLFICSNFCDNMNILFPKDSREHAGITIWQTTPSLFLKSGIDNIKKHILNKDSKLKILALGGEPMLDMDKLKIMKNNYNTTEIYNLYGITEVSCWASINKLDFSNPNSSVQTYLGTPLANTLIRICDDENKCVALGKGNIQIGSNLRKCMVGSEIENQGAEFFDSKCILWRDSGDIGEVKGDGKIYFRGRKDRVIKRYGHKVNLLEIETLASNLTEVDQCECVWLPKYDSLLLLFSSVDEVEETLWAHLKTHLAKHSMPDFVHRIDQIPLSSHGKISKSKVHNIFENILSHSKDVKFKSLFLDIISDILPLVKSDKYQEKSFQENGGNSIMALQLINKIENITKIDYSFMFSHLMSKSSLKSVMQKMQIKIASIDCKLNKEEDKVKIPMWENIVCSEENKRRNSFENQHPKKLCKDLNSKRIEKLWSINLGKCIDANPVIYSNSRIPPLILVGSHSGKVAVVNASSGDLVGMVDVSSRVEAPILCYEDDSSESYAIFGDYDGTLWCLSLQSFGIQWKRVLGGMIKSKACYDTSIIYAATYESVIWSICCKTGNILSKFVIGKLGISADLAKSNAGIFAATLDGIIICASITKNNLSTKWKKQLSSPVFAAPVFLKNDLQVLFSEVKGVVHCFEILTGNLMWNFSDTRGLIFSSSLVYKLNGEELIAFGCHDHHSYHLHSPDKSHYVLHTRVQHSSEVYSAPAVTDDHCVVCIATSGDLQIINPQSKQVLCSYQIPGKVFSSPVVFQQMIFVGCRDDNLYCFRIIS